MKQKMKTIAKAAFRMAIIVGVIMLLGKIGYQCDNNSDKEPFENCVNACLATVESSHLADEWSIPYREMVCAEFCYKEYIAEPDFEKKYLERR